MSLPLYELQSEERDGMPGFRICLNFRGTVLPIPNLWFRSAEVASMRISAMEREDFELMQQQKREK